MGGKSPTGSDDYTPLDLADRLLAAIDATFHELTSEARAGLSPGFIATYLRLDRPVDGLESLPPQAAVAALRHRAALGTLPSPALGAAARAAVAPHSAAPELFSLCLWAGLAAQATPPEDEGELTRALAEAFAWGVAPQHEALIRLVAPLGPLARAVAQSSWLRRRLIDDDPDMELLTDVAVALPHPVARLGALVDLACRGNAPGPLDQRWASAARQARADVGNFHAPGVADAQLATVVRWSDPAAAEVLLAQAVTALDKLPGPGDRSHLYDALFPASAWVSFPGWRALADGLSGDRRLKKRPALFGKVALAAVTSIEHLGCDDHRDAALSALSGVPRVLLVPAFSLAFVAESARVAASLPGRSAGAALARVDAALEALFEGEHGRVMLPAVAASYVDASPLGAIAAAQRLTKPVWRALWLFAVGDQISATAAASPA